MRGTTGTRRRLHRLRRPGPGEPRGRGRGCDGRDNDCNGEADDGEPVDGLTAWRDGDNDSYGDPADPAVVCEVPAGYVLNDENCDDGDAAVHPGAPELCNDGVDGDCDGSPTNCTLDLANADGRLLGEGEVNSAGSALASAGDVDGDGHPDLLVGAYGYSGEHYLGGAAYVVRGPASGDQELAHAQARLLGVEEQNLAGGAVAGVGDLDGDGYDDLLVGADRNDSAHALAGAAYLVLGPVSGSWSLDEIAQAIIVGEAPNEWLGGAPAGAGDTSGDGQIELLIGSCGPGDDDASPAAYLVAGLPEGKVHIEDALARLIPSDNNWAAGEAVAGVGDFDGDGLADVVVGDSGDDRGGSGAGAANVLLGPLSGTVEMADEAILYMGEFGSDRAGAALAAAGDVDGDGLADQVVGAAGQDSGGDGAGAAHVVLGSAVRAPGESVSLGEATARLLGTSEDAAAGRSVAGDVDVDGDELPDLLIGGASFYAVVGPFSGTASLSAAAVQMQADDLGRVVAGHAGRESLLLGVPSDDTNGGGAGAVFVVQGIRE